MTIATAGMTRAYGEEREQQIGSTYPGMAFFAGTGPDGKTCGTCKFKGYHRNTSKTKWDEETQQEVYKTRRVGGCEIFKKLSGKHGPDVPSDAHACKYYEPR